MPSSTINYLRLIDMFCSLAREKVENWGSTRYFSIQYVVHMEVFRRGRRETEE